MSSSGFVGTWEVERNEPFQDKNSFKGIRFRLHTDGDVTWYVPEELKSIPLFNCSIYDTNAPLYSSRESIWVRFGEYEGQIIEFQSDQRKPKDTVILRAEGLYTLHCKRVPEEISEEKCRIPFSLLPALEGGFFSDVTLISSNNKKFHVHSLILNIIGHGIDWHSKSHPLCNLSEDVLGNILHFMYTESLPENFDEEAAEKMISVANQHPFLNKLSSICQTYLKNEAFRKQCINLVNEIHESMDKLIKHIKPKHSLPVEYLIANPDHLSSMIKNCIRDAGIGFIKLIELCDLYNKKKSELTKYDQYSIIRYGNTRFFVLVAQVKQFLQILKGSYGSMNRYQKKEIATFLVPEVSGILDMLTELLMHVDHALERIVTLLDVEDFNKSKSSFRNSCSYFLYQKEMKFLRKFSETINCSYELLMQKRRNFMEMSPLLKRHSISLNIEEIVDEMPNFFLVRLEELMDYQDKILEWRDFKFFFQTCSSKVSNFMQLMVTHRYELQQVSSSLCLLVQRDTFNQSMQNLGLMETDSNSSNEDNLPKSAEDSGNSKKCTNEINFLDSLCIPPKFDESTLSKNLLEQFKNSTNTDMEFEIVKYSEGDFADHSTMPRARERCIIKAHRVVVASRCDWFRKALLSGMKEDIDKKIVIYETNSETYNIFLQYLYTGNLCANSMTSEQLVDLLVLSDKFEMDVLKGACEMALKFAIDTDNAIYLLSLADSYNAKTLKVNCMNFIIKNQEVMESDMFYQLSRELHVELYDHIWTQPVTDPRRLKKSYLKHRRSYEPTGIDGHFSRMNMQHTDQDDTDVQDQNRLERCISHIRDIIGEDASTEQLKLIILAADYDLCRAINFYYAKNNQ